MPRKNTTMQHYLAKVILIDIAPSDCAMVTIKLMWRKKKKIKGKDYWN